MKKVFSLITAFILAFAGLTPWSHAEQSAAQLAQQNKMSACSKEGKGKKGDERKAFMKECLGSKTAAAAEPAKTSAPVAKTSKDAPKDASNDTSKAAPQTSKMKSCNQDAIGKTGDERKAFMKQCLKK
jgi:hypothetical protein